MHAAPERAPKSQLAEQPWTGGCWNPPKKDAPHSKTKEKLPQDQRRSNHDKIKPHTDWVDNPQTGETILIPKKFHQCCEGSEPHVCLPSQRIWQRDWESLGESDFESQWDLIAVTSARLGGGTETQDKISKKRREGEKKNLANILPASEHFLLIPNSLKPSSKA